MKLWTSKTGICSEIFHRKRLTGMHSLSYAGRLKVLALKRLELRPLHADLIMCYKIVYGLISIPFESFSSWVYSKTLVVIR